MIFRLITIKFILFTVTIETSSEQLENKPHYRAHDVSCINDRSQSDTREVKYNHHIVYDGHHPYFSEIVEPRYEIKKKLKDSSNIGHFVENVFPIEEVHKNQRRINKFSKGNENLNPVQKINIPNSDAFICAAYGFFPGMNL